MANKVAPSPALPQNAPDPFSQSLVQAVLRELQAHAARLNLAVPNDGTEVTAYPVRLGSFAVASLPAAADYTGGTIFVPDETGGATMAFSDGTNWRRVQDRVIVS